MPFTIRPYRRFAVPCTLVLVVLCAASVRAGVEEGFAAYERGDYATALKVYRPLAEQGDVIAQYNFGLMYQKGQGTEQDYGRALHWYRKAAEQGEVKAQFKIGMMHYTGQDTSRN